MLSAWQARLYFPPALTDRQAWTEEEAKINNVESRESPGSATQHLPACPQPEAPPADPLSDWLREAPAQIQLHFVLTASVGRKRLLGARSPHAAP